VVGKIALPALLNLGIEEQLMAIDRILISIHGIETDGTWQDEIDRSFQGIAGLAYDKYKYGKFHFWETAFASAREDEIVAFAKKWDEVYRETGVVPSVIAHSFGTYIICRAMIQFPVLKFDRIILCGSILDCDFDWPGMIAAGRVQAVLNETAGDDGVVAMFRNAVLRSIINGSGPSGLDGFKRDTPMLEQRHYPELKHSGAFVLRSHCDDFWRPFIFDNVAFAEQCGRARNNHSERETLRKQWMPVIGSHLRKFFGPTDSPAAAALATVVFDHMVKYGVEGVHSAEGLIFAIVSGLWQKSQ
jgi:pimeloyl-ACP methyl ester carboxylesterase